MTTQPIADLNDDCYVRHAFAPSRPIVLRLPPVRPRPGRAWRGGRLFTTLTEYAELTQRLRAAATHA